MMVLDFRIWIGLCFEQNFRIRIGFGYYWNFSERIGLSNFNIRTTLEWSQWWISVADSYFYGPLLLLVALMDLYCCWLLSSSRRYSQHHPIPHRQSNETNSNCRIRLFQIRLLHTIKFSKQHFSQSNSTVPNQTAPDQTTPYHKILQIRQSTVPNQTTSYHTLTKFNWKQGSLFLQLSTPKFCHKFSMI